MKNFFKVLFFVLIASFVMPSVTKASHLAGGEFSFVPTGVPNQFHVTVKMYRDCNGIALPTSLDICYHSSICGLSGTANLPDSATICFTSTTCVQIPSVCSCGGEIEVHYYTGDVTLPQQCTDWVFDYETSARNGAITTGLANLGFYIYSTLNNVVAPVDHSPEFKTLAYTTFCVGNAFYYDQGASDLDGDSLVFSLVNAEDATGSCPLTPTSLASNYISPFSAINPISSSVPITINPQTGVIYFIPSQVQVGVICVLVEEFRNGVKIGSIKRDIQVKIVGQCNPVIPAIANSVIGSLGASGRLYASCNDTSVVLPLDTTYLIQCSSAIPSDFRTINPLGYPNPIINVSPVTCSNGKTDSLRITFLNPLTSGVTRLWVKKGFDGNTFLSDCGFEYPEGQDTVYIYIDSTVVTQLGTVTDSLGCVFNNLTLNLTDSVYCSTIAPDGSDFIFKDATGTTFPIIGANGYCSPNGLKTKSILISFAANVSGTAPFYLLLDSASTDGNTIGDDCARFVTKGDTLGIFYLNNKINIDLGPAINTCNNLPAPVLNAGISGLTYQWYNGANAIPGATNQTYTPTVTGVYSVSVTNGPICNGSDTISVTINPAPVNNLGNSIVQCVNDPLPTFDAGNPGATFQWLLNGIPINGATSQTYTVASATDTGVYSVQVNNGSICTATFNIGFNTFNQIPVTLSNQTICSSSSYPVLDAAVPNQTYQWSFNGSAISGATNQTYQTTQAGSYSVLVGSGSCSGTASMVLSVVNAPTDNLGTDINQCVNLPLPTFNAGNAGYSYQWLYNGTPITNATNQTYTVPNTASTGTYSVILTSNQSVCQDTFDIQFNVVSQYQVTTLSNQTICANGNYPLLDAGNPGATYQWSLNGNAISGATNQTYQTAQGGTYAVQVGTGSCAGNGSMTLTVVNLPVVSLSNATICSNQTIAALDAGNAGASYQWSQDGTPISGATSQTYTPTAAGNYSVDVTVQPGCTSSGSMTLTINTAPTLALNDTSICSDGQASLDAGNVADSYLWSNGATSQSISVKTAGNYILTATKNGCAATDTVNVQVFNYPVAPVVKCGTGTGTFKFIYTWNAIAGAASYEVSEDNGQTWTAANTPSGNESHGTNNAVPFFLVRAISSNAICKTGAASEPAACEVTVPNIITPNGDGKNDYLKIENIEQYPRNSVKIFNRWGKEVFSAEPYDNSTNRFTGKDIPDGAYFILVDLGDSTRSPISKTLTITR